VAYAVVPFFLGGTRLGARWLQLHGVPNLW
jgi:hypothetical protein